MQINIEQMINTKYDRSLKSAKASKPNNWLMLTGSPFTGGVSGSVKLNNPSTIAVPAAK